MKLSKSTLKNLIKEELDAIEEEDFETIEEVDDSVAGVARAEKEDANFARSRVGKHILMLQKRIEKLEAIIKNRR